MSPVAQPAMVFGVRIRLQTRHASTRRLGRIGCAIGSIPGRSAVNSRVFGPVTVTGAVGFVVLLLGLFARADTVSIVTLLVGLALLVTAALMAVLNGSLR